MKHHLGRFAAVAGAGVAAATFAWWISLGSGLATAIGLPWALSAAGTLLLSLIPALRSWRAGPAATVALSLGVFVQWHSGSSGGISLNSALGFSYRQLIVLLGLVWLGAAVAFVQACWREHPRLVFWLLCFMGCVWAISGLSGSAGGAEPMIGWLERFLGLSPQAAETVSVVARKSIHFGFYGFTAFAMMRAATQGGVSALAGGSLGITASMALAAFDETRQTLAANRTGSLADAALDLLGACAFVAVGLHRLRPEVDRALPGNPDATET